MAMRFDWPTRVYYEDTGCTRDDARQIRHLIELQSLHDPETIAQR